MTLKAVLFDLGNTLITYPNPDEVIPRFHEMAAEITADEMLPKLDYSTLLKKLAEKYLELRQTSFQTLKEATFAEGLKLALQDLGLEMSPLDQMYVLENLYDEFFSSEAKVIPGALEILDFLEASQLQIAVISNTPWVGSGHYWDMDNLDIVDIRSGREFPVYWSSQEGIRKPHPELFRKALRKLNVAPDEAIYVGDNFSRDVVGPNSIGMKAIWISTKPIPEGQTLNGWQVADLVAAKAVVETLIKENKV